MIDDPLPELPAGAFSKQDPGDDLAFYAHRGWSRTSTKDSAGADRMLSGALPGNSQVLDLMSSWVSHLPSDQTYAAVTATA